MAFLYMIGYPAIFNKIRKRYDNDGRKPWEEYSCGTKPDVRNLVYIVFLESSHGATSYEISSLLDLPHKEVRAHISSLFDGRHIFKARKLRSFEGHFGLVYSMLK